MLNNNSHQSISHLPTITAHATQWARQAGQIAMRYFKNVSLSYKADNSLLTQADTEIEQFLVEQIRATYPRHGLLCEEGSRRQADSDSPYVWVIDPLDGTTAFAQGLPGWGIAIGLLYDGQPIFGLFYMPLLNDLTYSSLPLQIGGGTGIYCNEEFLQPTLLSRWHRKSFLAVTAGAHHDFNINLSLTRALGSVGSSLVYTARGAATAALIPKAYLWDLVAGGIILNRVGGELRYLSGKPVNYQAMLNGSITPEPIIASHPDLFAELQKAIQPRTKEKIIDSFITDHLPWAMGQWSMINGH